MVLEDVEIELSKVYARVVITKKKHYTGIFEDMNQDPDIKGMEGIKSDKPHWINQIHYNFVDDLKYDDTGLLHEFRLHLADLDVKLKNERRRLETKQQNSNSNYYGFPTNSIPKSYQWIEDKLLQTAIPDHRKYTAELLLAPYLINIKHLQVGNTYSLIKHWILKCNALTRLEPSTEYFDNKIKTAINNSLQNGIPPIKKENMRRRYPNWYNDFKEWLILD
jgi:DNA polymerase family B